MARIQEKLRAQLVRVVGNDVGVQKLSQLQEALQHDVGEVYAPSRNADCVVLKSACLCWWFPETS